MELVPIKVRIDRKSAKSGAINDYPKFNQINSDIRKGMDWSSYLDEYGSGMIYGTEVEGNEEKQYCIMCVPEDFAAEALKLFGDKVEEIDESTLDTWYDAKGPGRNQSEELVNTDALTAIRVREELGEDVSALKARALDPKDDTPGISENPNKTWTRKKAELRIEIIPRLRKPGPSA